MKTMVTERTGRRGLRSAVFTILILVALLLAFGFFAVRTDYGQQSIERALTKRLGIPIEGMVRGHDHVNAQSERWERREEVKRASYEGRILTINTMSHNQRGDWLGDHTPPNPRAPTLARWRQGELLPTPIIVDLSAELVNWYAPECPNCHHPNQTGATMCEREQCRTSLH